MFFRFRKHICLIIIKGDFSYLNFARTCAHLQKDFMHLPWKFCTSPNFRCSLRNFNSLTANQRNVGGKILSDRLINTFLKWFTCLTHEPQCAYLVSITFFYLILCSLANFPNDGKCSLLVSGGFISLAKTTFAKDILTYFKLHQDRHIKPSK